MLLSATRNPRDAIFDIFISRLQVPRAQFPLARSENEAQAPKRPSCDQFSSRLPHSFASFCCCFFSFVDMEKNWGGIKSGHFGLNMSFNKQTQKESLKSSNLKQKVRFEYRRDDWSTFRANWVVFHSISWYQAQVIYNCKYEQRRSQEKPIRTQNNHRTQTVYSTEKGG